MSEDEKRTSAIPAEFETCARVVVAAKQFLSTGIFPYRYEALSDALFITNDKKEIKGERNWIDCITDNRKIVSVYLEKNGEKCPSVVVSYDEGDSVWQLESEGGEQIRATEVLRKKKEETADAESISRFTAILKKNKPKNKKAIKLLQNEKNSDDSEAEGSGVCEILACSFIYSPYGENVYFALSLAREGGNVHVDMNFEKDWCSVFIFCINELDLYKKNKFQFEAKYPLYKNHIQNAIKVIQENIFPVCLNANNQLFEEVKRCPQLYVLFKEETIDKGNMKAQPFIGNVQDKPTVFICSSREQTEHFIEKIPSYKYRMSEITNDDFFSICCCGVVFKDLQFLVDGAELFVQVPVIEYLKYVTVGKEIILNLRVGGISEDGSGNMKYPLGLYDYKPLYQ